MKTRFTAFIFFFSLVTAVFGQSIDRNQYTAIDPFDYRLDEDRAIRGAARRFKSVVRFVSENRSGNYTYFIFSSLDNNTTLDLNVPRHISSPSPGQVLTIYFTATKRVVDTRVLDDIDLTNTTESGIGLVQSSIPASSGINRSDYTNIDPFDYRSDIIFTREGEVRKYRSRVQFVSKDGITYFFSCPEGVTILQMRVRRRFPPFTAGQTMTVYYTASKEFLDHVVLDDIEL